MKNLFLLFFIIYSKNTLAQPAVKEIFYPKYVQGVGSGSPADDRKVPYACRMQINGLSPKTTYRYYTRFGNRPIGSTGAGNFILVNQKGDFTRVEVASLSSEGKYGQFTTDESGNVTEWFILEPTSASDFVPGTQLWWRVFLNDGAGGKAVVTRITATNPVTVLGWGSDKNQGTGLRCTANPDYKAKNFVMLYANNAGTGRPEAGTFIENDGTVNAGMAKKGTLNAGYAAFYGEKVDGVDKTWGTIIPNNLSTGIRNISQYSLADGSFINKCTSPDGKFGTVNTGNLKAGLNEQVIECNTIKK